MKLQFTQKRKAVAGLSLFAALLLAFPRQSYALFGFGDIVFDPTSFATLGHIWSEDVTMGVKLAQEYTQLVKIYTNAQENYLLAKQMAVSVHSKASWMTVATGASNEFTVNRYGEAINWQSVMRGDAVHAGMAYNNATIRLSPQVDLSSETLGSSYQLANLASVETMDSAHQACLAAVAQYRANQKTNQAAADALTGKQADETDGTNSTVAQLNELNGAAAQARAETQSQGTLQACLVEQQALANTVQRNQQVEAFNTYAQVQKGYANHPAMLDNVSTSLNADIR